MTSLRKIIQRGKHTQSTQPFLKADAFKSDSPHQREVHFQVSKAWREEVLQWDFITSSHGLAPAYVVSRMLICYFPHHIFLPARLLWSTRFTSWFWHLYDQ